MYANEANTSDAMPVAAYLRCRAGNKVGRSNQKSNFESIHHRVWTTNLDPIVMKHAMTDAKSRCFEFQVSNIWSGRNPPWCRCSHLCDFPVYALMSKLHKQQGLFGKSLHASSPKRTSYKGRHPLHKETTLLSQILKMVKIFNYDRIYCYPSIRFLFTYLALFR